MNAALAARGRAEEESGDVVKQRMTIAVGLMSFVLCAAPPGYAQAPRPVAKIVPPHEVMTIVRSTGLNPVGRPIRAGATYVLRATTTRGIPMRVVVDARRGRILTVGRVVPEAYGPVAAAPNGPPVPPPYAPYGLPEPPPDGAPYGPDAPDVPPGPPPYGDPYGADVRQAPPGRYDHARLVPIPPAGIRARPAVSSVPPLPRPRPGNIVADRSGEDSKPAATTAATPQPPDNSGSGPGANPLPFNH
jgi:hypothetical protein